MPHKHVRRKGDDRSSYDLAPNQIAKPLPTHTARSKPNSNSNDSRKRKRDAKTGNSYKHDDTPRAFARMMNFNSSNKRQRSGLDDGDETRRAKKKQQKRADGKNDSQTDQAQERAQEALNAESAQLEAPKILPGERLRDFAARVDHAFPVGSLTRKGKVSVEGLKERQTKKERKLHKMYAAWREEDARRKEMLEEQQEEDEEEEAERSNALGGQSISFPTSNRKAKRQKKGVGAGEDDEDPWGELKAKRDQRRGLHDVVQAPPTFEALPKEKFKVRNGAKVDVSDVPTAAGSLKRREELSDTRREVIERYRGMMGR